MSTYDLMFERAAAGVEPRGILGRLKQALTSLRHRREAAATVLELSRMDEYLLRDIGLEPQDVHDALRRRDLSILLNPIRR
jgi:uncharacterized protein YjiS (DUF1127 family)